MTKTEQIDAQDMFPEVKASPESLQGEEMDRITISNNTDSVVLTLSKHKNRLIKMTIKLNGEEIKPATFVGIGQALAYWNLLKRTLGGDQ